MGETTRQRVHTTTCTLGREELPKKTRVHSRPCPGHAASIASSNSRQNASMSLFTLAFSIAVALSGKGCQMKRLRAQEINHRRVRTTIGRACPAVLAAVSVRGPRFMNCLTTCRWDSRCDMLWVDCVSKSHELNGMNSICSSGHFCRQCNAPYSESCIPAALSYALLIINDTGRETL